MANIRTKYNIQNEDFYNFDKTGFIIGIIYGNMIITYTDRRGRSKQLQSGNWEWATAIEYMDNDGFVLPLFLIV